MANIKKIILSDWLIAMVISLVIILAYFLQWGPLQSLEYKTYDFRARMLAEEPESQVTIIAIEHNPQNPCQGY